MTHYRNLTKLFIRSLRLNKANSKRGRFFFRFLMTISIVFILIPFLLIFSVFIGDMMVKLDDVGFASIGFEVLVGLMLVFMFVFSFNVILNELYFSDDIDNLLPLPIKAETLVASKFSSCFLVENVVVFFFLFFACLSFVVATKTAGVNLLLSFIGILLLPLAPMVYGVLISMLFIYLFRSVLNKKTMRRIGIILLFLLIFGIYYLLRKVSVFNFESYVEQFAGGDREFLDVLRILFPGLQFFVKGLYEGSILSIILYYLIQAITFVVMLLFARFFYYKGLMCILNKDTETRKSSIRKIRDYRIKTPFVSYCMKELKVLFRSPTFFINCIIINFIWPIFVFLIFKVGLSGYTISKMQLLCHSRDLSFLFLMFLIITGISIIIPAFNSIASSSFSREGKNYQFIKYIPMKYGLQWRAKLLISFVIPFLGIYLFAFPFFIRIHLPIEYFLLFITISVMSILFVSFIGMLIDSLYPKVVWDDEADALRENYNAFIAMGFSLLLFGIICGGGYYLEHYLNVSISVIILISFLILLLGCIILYWISHKKISYFIKIQETV